MWPPASQQCQYSFRNSVVEAVVNNMLARDRREVFDRSHDPGRRTQLRQTARISVNRVSVTPRPAFNGG